MNKNIVTVIIFIFIVVNISGCGIQQNSEGTSGNSIIEKQSSGMIQSSPATVTDSISSKGNNTQVSTTKSTEISSQEMKKFLNSKRSEILKTVGNSVENGDTVSIMESHMVFPVLFVKKLGLTFIFPNETDDYTPTYISIAKATNVQNLNLSGAMPGMKFKDIVGKVGKGKVEKTWIANEDNVAYKLDFKKEGLIYSFLSFDEDGTDSELYISLDSDE